MNLHEESVSTLGESDGGLRDQAKERGVFVTYSWESPEHRQWTERLAERLHGDGVPIVLDRWDLVLGDSLTQFMEAAVRDSQYVLVVCTPEYKRRSDERLGGVGYEGHIMTAEVLNTNPKRKFIPVLASGTKETAIPTWLSGRMYADLATGVGTPAFESEYEELRALLLGQRRGPPPAGQLSTRPPAPTIPPTGPTPYDSSLDRAVRLGDSLASIGNGTTARRDAVREALEVVVTEVESLARTSNTPVGVVSPSGEFEVGADFLRAVDEVLGGMLPLLKAEDEGLEDAQAMLLQWLELDPELSPAAAFLEAVASIAMHLLAAVAWRWQRGTTLGWCIERLAGRYRSLVYLRAFEGWSNRSSWAVERALRDSPVILRLAPEVRGSTLPTQAAANHGHEVPPAALLCVVGLIAMRGVWFGRVGEISAELRRGEKPPMLDWPAFQHEYRNWVEVLPEQLLRMPRWEREVASMALDVSDVHLLRRYWAKNGSVLTRLHAAAYSLRNRDGDGWGREYPSPAWRDWVQKA